MLLLSSLCILLAVLGFVMKKEIDEYRVQEPGFLIFFVAVMLASGASFALATYMLELSSAWVALLAGAAFGALGFSLGENVGDAIIFSLIVGLLVFFFIKVGPEIEIIRAVIVLIATGFCVGKLVYGFCKEIS
jgi:hypothetical protein